MDAAVRYSNATFSNVCRKNGAQRGGGRVSLFLFFSSSFFFFFWKFVRRVWAVFAFDIFVPPLSLFFFPPIHPLIRAPQKLGCV